MPLQTRRVPVVRNALVASALILSLLAASLVFSPTPLAAQGSACPPVDNPVDEADPAITVVEPAPGDSVTSPVRINGEARVFEANVRIMIFDAAGNAVADSFTTAAAGAPEMAPFATQIVFQVNETQEGCLWVFEESAQDGSAVNVVAVPVTLEADEVGPEPAPTGDAGIGSNASAVVLVLTLAGAAWVVLAGRVVTGSRSV